MIEPQSQWKKQNLNVGLQAGNPERPPDFFYCSRRTVQKINVTKLTVKFYTV